MRCAHIPFGFMPVNPNAVKLAPYIPTTLAERITEDSKTRLTEDGKIRIVE